MLKFIKKVIVIMIHLSITFLFFTYRIIHNFIEKHKSKIKEILSKIDEELKKQVIL